MIMSSPTIDPLMMVQSTSSSTAVSIPYNDEQFQPSTSSSTTSTLTNMTKLNLSDYRKQVRGRRRKKKIGFIRKKKVKKNDNSISSVSAQSDKKPKKWKKLNLRKTAKNMVDLNLDTVIYSCMNHYISDHVLEKIHLNLSEELRNKNHIFDFETSLDDHYEWIDGFELSCYEDPFIFKMVSIFQCKNHIEKLMKMRQEEKCRNQAANVSYSNPFRRKRKRDEALRQSIFESDANIDGEADQNEEFYDVYDENDYIGLDPENSNQHEINNNSNNEVVNKSEFPETSSKIKKSSSKKVKRMRKRHSNYSENSFNDVSEKLFVEAFTRTSSRGRLIKPKSRDSWDLQEEDLNQLDEWFTLENHKIRSSLNALKQETNDEPEATNEKDDSHSASLLSKKIVAKSKTLQSLLANSNDEPELIDDKQIIFAQTKSPSPTKSTPLIKIQPKGISATENSSAKSPQSLLFKNNDESKLPPIRMITHMNKSAAYHQLMNSAYEDLEMMNKLKLNTVKKYDNDNDENDDDDDPYKMDELFPFPLDNLTPARVFSRFTPFGWKSFMMKHNEQICYEISSGNIGKDRVVYIEPFKKIEKTDKEKEDNDESSPEMDNEKKITNDQSTDNNKENRFPKIEYSLCLVPFIGRLKQDDNEFKLYEKTVPLLVKVMMRDKPANNSEQDCLNDYLSILNRFYNKHQVRYAKKKEELDLQKEERKSLIRKNIIQDVIEQQSLYYPDYYVRAQKPKPLPLNITSMINSNYGVIKFTTIPKSTLSSSSTTTTTTTTTTSSSSSTTNKPIIYKIANSNFTTNRNSPLQLIKADNTPTQLSSSKITSNDNKQIIYAIRPSSLTSNNSIVLPKTTIKLQKNNGITTVQKVNKPPIITKVQPISAVFSGTTGTKIQSISAVVSGTAGSKAHPISNVVSVTTDSKTQSTSTVVNVSGSVSNVSVTTESKVHPTSAVVSEASESKAQSTSMNNNVFEKAESKVHTTLPVSNVFKTYGSKAQSASVDNKVSDKTGSKVQAVSNVINVSETSESKAQSTDTNICEEAVSKVHTSPTVTNVSETSGCKVQTTTADTGSKPIIIQVTTVQLQSTFTRTTTIAQSKPTQIVAKTILPSPTILSAKPISTKNPETPITSTTRKVLSKPVMVQFTNAQILKPTVTTTTAMAGGSTRIVLTSEAIKNKRITEQKSDVNCTKLPTTENHKIPIKIESKPLGIGKLPVTSTTTTTSSTAAAIKTSGPTLLFLSENGSLLSKPDGMKKIPSSLIRKISKISTSSSTNKLLNEVEPTNKVSATSKLSSRPSGWHPFKTRVRIKNGKVVSFLPDMMQPTKNGFYKTNLESNELEKQNGKLENDDLMDYILVDDDGDEKEPNINENEPNDQQGEISKECSPPPMNVQDNSTLKQKIINIFGKDAKPETNDKKPDIQENKLRNKEEN